MNAGADVGVGVLAVNQSDQLREDIVPGEVGDAEILPVGEQELQCNHGKKRHAQIGHVTFKPLVVIPH